MDRRRFLQVSTGATAVTLWGATPERARGAPRSPIEIRAWRASGGPLPQAVLELTYFLSLADEPLPNPPRTVSEGLLLTEAPPEPFAIAIRRYIEGFGNVTLYADRQGQGYRAADFPLNLNLACAQTRIERVSRTIATWRTTGYQPSQTVETQLQKANSLYKQATQATEPAEMATLVHDSLYESLWAGETAVFEQAKQQIARNGTRPDFLFGCNFFGHPHSGEAYDTAFRDLFNYATLPFYWRSFEPERGKPNLAQIDQSLQWLKQAGITAKGHPLVWFHEVGVPDWIKEIPYRQVHKLVRTHVTETTRYFGDRIPYYDIINEAHDIDWGNILNFSSAQMLAFTRLASEATAAGAPQANRIINTCCAWAEYVRNSSPKNPTHSGFHYLQRCLDTGIPFETIGLQLYYPDQDMFEINRLIERFGTLGKPVHITELGVSSATTRDEESLLKDPLGLWHGPWTEAIQADWVEQFYTLCYSKPYIHAITWWDLADDGFWPHGGLLRSDFQPKESYLRLKELRQQWS